MVNQESVESVESFKFTELSRELTKAISKDDKKNNGIYFTPPTTIHKNLTILQPYMEKVKDVLEPSCGSCEYISALHEMYPTVNITGIELNETIFESIEHLQNKQIILINVDFLEYRSRKKYDLIIGNPPYFVMKKGDVDEYYYDFFDGRPNIFVLFIIKSLSLLKKNGIISFVLPSSFINCLYYDKTRKYINEHYRIIQILECNDQYIETKQDTIIVILQNSPPNENNKQYTMDISDFTIFGIPSTLKALQELYKGAKNLCDLNFTVNVGTVVWNQCKTDLTDNCRKTLLIYSSDIENNQLSIKTYSNEKKKNYINKKGMTHPLLVINRGYGVGNYQFNYCIINEKDDTVEYLIENHLICIHYTKTVSKEELITMYKKITKSFENEKTVEFVKLYFGNNAINTTELCKILPIYYDI